MAESVDPIDLQIGARLRALREARGVSRTELAAAIGAETLALVQIEGGVAPAPVAMVVRIAMALGASAADLMGEERQVWRGALQDLALAGPAGSVEMVFAFCAISDRQVRRAFLDLAWSMVEAQVVSVQRQLVSARGQCAQTQPASGHD
jgi:transcriptional regulator with XRE-family HTH domain